MNWEIVKWFGGCCLLFVFAALALLLYYAYRWFSNRPPTRTGKELNKKIWQSLNGTTEFNGGGKTISLETDEDSARSTGSFKCRGVANFGNTWVVMLAEEHSWFPRREVIVAPRKYVKDLQYDDIKILGNAFVVWGDILKVKPRADWMGEADYWNKELTKFWNEEILDHMSSSLMAKTNEETLAVLDLSPQRTNILDKIIDRGEKIFNTSGGDESAKLE